MKKIINSILHTFGYQIRATHVPLQSFSEGMRQVAKLISVDVVIDVGVAHHTNGLYEAFRDKELLLIEANPAFTENLKTLKDRYNARVEMVFCGEKKGTVTLNVPKNNRRASAYTEASADHTQVDIAMDTLDEIVRRNDLVDKSCILKVDVEGGELDVLKGASKTLTNAQAVILEICWGVPFTERAANYVAVINFMEENGFSLFNIVEGGGIKLHKRLTHADFIFVRKDNSSI